MASSRPHYVGIDVGGTNVKMVAVDEAGNRIARTQFASLDGWAEGVRGGLSRWRNDRGEPAGIGVASPGLVAPDRRSIAWMQGRMASLRGFDWTASLQSDNLVPVSNDAQAALLAEAWIGAARDAKNVVMLTLGTGVGGAAMVDGRVLSGALGRAGHLGHISLNPEGPADIVGTPGSLEDAIGDATVARRSGGAFANTQELVEALRLGDACAQRVWADSVRALAAGLVSLINVLDPEVVILGGGIAGAGDDLFRPLAVEMETLEWRPFGARVPIVPAAIGDEAGALGAARFAMTLRLENF